MNPKGKAVIFSAPSGAGKTSIVRALLQTNLPLQFSISACSREPRGYEQHGVDYYFLGLEGFREKIDRDAFLEWEEVYPNQYYGTLKSEIERIWAMNAAVIFDVDVYGGLTLKRMFGEKALAIFVEPPSIEALEHRLRQRNSEPEEKIAIRLAKAREELSKKDEFDLVLLNEHLAGTVEQAYAAVIDFLEK